MYNHNSITCLVTGCLRAVTCPPPDPAGLGEQGRNQQSVHDEAEQEEEQVEDLSSDSPDVVEQP